MKSGWINISQTIKRIYNEHSKEALPFTKTYCGGWHTDINEFKIQ